MERIKFYIKKYKNYLIIVIFLIIIITLILMPNKRQEEKEVVSSNIEEKRTDEKEETEIKMYKIDIKGEVKKPGVYELPENSRVIDVINVAGGVNKDATTEYLNLSKKITDEMIIIIYNKKDIDKFKKDDKEIIYVEYKCECPDNINDACIKESDKVNTKEKDKSNTLDEKDEKTNKKVSLNTATKEELMGLSGIGESKAIKIIEYREKNNGFKSLEEIMEVSGIGESLYSKIKDNIEL